MVAGFLVGLPREAEEAGWNLLDLLKENEISLSGAFWAEFETDDWRLHLVTPRVGLGEARAFWVDVLNAIEEHLKNREERDSEGFTFLRNGRMIAIDPERQIVKQILQSKTFVQLSNYRRIHEISLGYTTAYIYFLNKN